MSHWFLFLREDTMFASTHTPISAIILIFNEKQVSYVIGISGNEDALLHLQIWGFMFKRNTPKAFRLKFYQAAN